MLPVSAGRPSGNGGEVSNVTSPLRTRPTSISASMNPRLCKHLLLPPGAQICLAMTNFASDGYGAAQNAKQRLMANLAILRLRGAVAGTSILPSRSPGQTFDSLGNGWSLTLAWEPRPSAGPVAHHFGGRYSTLNWVGGWVGGGVGCPWNRMAGARRDCRVASAYSSSSSSRALIVGLPACDSGKR